MVIEDLAKQYSNSIHGYKLVKYFEAASPLYKMELNFTMQKKKALTALQEFIMKFIQAGIDDTEMISYFLGLNNSVVNTSIADLRTKDLVSVDINYKKIKLTNSGVEALEKASLIVPEEITYPVYIDGITSNIFLDKRRYYVRKEVNNVGMVPLVPYIEEPLLIDIKFEELNRAINKYKKDNENHTDNMLEGKLLAINDLKKVYVQYKKLYVLVFLNEKIGNVELRIFDRSSRSQEYETRILQMYNENLNLIQFDEKSVVDNSENKILAASIPNEIWEEAKRFDKKNNEYNKEISSIQTQIIEYKEEIENAQSKEKKESSTQKIRFLEEKINKLENEKNSAHRILNTYDHRPLLIKALKESRKIIIIVSPWIKQSGTNQEILNLVDSAVQKNIRVVIGYGISEEEQSDKRIINKLREIQNKKYGNNLKIINLSNTHEKVLISDDNFMIVTSFNWLSFRGDPKFGFRQETGLYTESKDCICEMKKNLENRMDMKL